MKHRPRNVTACRNVSEDMNVRIGRHLSMIRKELLGSHDVAGLTGLKWAT